MDGSLMRSAIGCAIACGAFVAGPLSLGAAVAEAGVLGIGGGGDGVDVLGIDVIGGNSSKSGGGGSAARANAVSTAPSARSVVIRTKPSTAQPDSSVVPAAFAAPSQQPAAVALGSRYIESVPAGATTGRAGTGSGGRAFFGDAACRARPRRACTAGAAGHDDEPAGSGRPDRTGPQLLASDEDSWTPSASVMRSTSERRRRATCWPRRYRVWRVSPGSRSSAPSRAIGRPRLFKWRCWRRCRPEF